MQLILTQILLLLLTLFLARAVKHISDLGIKVVQLREKHQQLQQQLTMLTAQVTLPETTSLNPNQ